MKVIEVNVISTYTCNVCNRWFQSKEEFDLRFLVICSKKCEFKFIYNLIKKEGYSEENYRNILKIIGKEQQKDTFNENTAIFEITKYYSNIGLPNIKHLGSRLKTKAQGSKMGTKAQGSSNSPPIYRGNEPEPEPWTLKGQSNCLSLKNFGGFFK